MTDIEKIDFALNYLNKVGKVNNLEMVFLHEAQFTLPRAERRKLYYAIINTGFVNVLDHSVGPDNAIEMNGAGYKMMEEYGSYSAYCEADKDTKRTTKEMEIRKTEALERLVKQKPDTTNQRKVQRKNTLFWIISFILATIGILLTILLR